MKYLFISVSILLLSLSSHAQYSVAESAEVLTGKSYRAGVQTLETFNNGLDVIGNFDAPVNDSTSMRVLLGTGEADFITGASLKYVPFPDVDKQPAIGVRGGITYSRLNKVGTLSLSAAPIVSKKVATDIGQFTPYAALPFGMNFYSGNVSSPVQMAFGTEYKHPDYETFMFGAECGINLTRAENYLSIYVSVGLDDDKGLHIK